MNTCLIQVWDVTRKCHILSRPGAAARMDVLAVQASGSAPAPVTQRHAARSRWPCLSVGRSQPAQPALPPGEPLSARPASRRATLGPPCLPSSHARPALPPVEPRSARPASRRATLGPPASRRATLGPPCLPSSHARPALPPVEPRSARPASRRATLGPPCLPSSHAQPALPPREPLSAGRASRRAALGRPCLPAGRSRPARYLQDLCCALGHVPRLRYELLSSLSVIY